MKKNDLISRAYVLAEYDRQHQGPPGAARKIMEDAPTIDAIPVEWIFEQMQILHELHNKNEYVLQCLMELWQKEQEGQDGKV